jgi:hypothetical protein
MLSLYELAKYKAVNNSKYFILFSIIINYALLIKPTLLYFNMLLNIVLVILVFFKKLGKKCFCVYLCCFLLVWGGWSLRNYHHYHVFTYTTVQMGNFYDKYVPRLTAYIEACPVSEAEKYHAKQFNALHPSNQTAGLNKAQILNLKQTYAVSYIVSHFGSFIDLNIIGLLKELFAFSTGNDSHQNYFPNMGVFLNGLVYGLSIAYLLCIYISYFAGLIVKRKSLTIIHGFIFALSAYILLVSAFWGATRFRAPVIPLLLLSAMNTMDILLPAKLKSILLPTDRNG